MLRDERTPCSTCTHLAIQAMQSRQQTPWQMALLAPLQFAAFQWQVLALLPCTKPPISIAIACASALVDVFLFEPLGATNARSTTETSVFSHKMHTSAGRLEYKLHRIMRQQRPLNSKPTARKTRE